MVGYVKWTPAFGRTPPAPFSPSLGRLNTQATHRTHANHGAMTPRVAIPWAQVSIV